MSLRLALPPALLRAAAAALAELLRAAPERLLQLKRVHVLPPEEAAPDGLSAAYLAQAAARNAAARPPADGLAARLLDEIEAELGRAVLLEARLLARLAAAR